MNNNNITFTFTMCPVLACSSSNNRILIQYTTLNLPVLKLSEDSNTITSISSFQSKQKRDMKKIVLKDRTRDKNNGNNNMSNDNQIIDNKLDFNKYIETSSSKEIDATETRSLYPFTAINAPMFLKCQSDDYD